MLINLDDTLTLTVETPSKVNGRTIRNIVDGDSYQVDAQWVNKEKMLKSYGISMKKDGYKIFGSVSIPDLDRYDIVKVNSVKHLVEYFRRWDNDHVMMVVLLTTQGSEA